MNKSVSTFIDKELSEQLKDCFSKQPKLIIGVSGGADSMALLYALKIAEIEAIVVHINYGLRGEDSDKDQELVEQLSFEWGFECVSVKPESKTENENFQNWARNQRYQIFLDLRQEVGADAIAVSHHQDDQVETILMKLFRGSAPENWQGMSVLEDHIFRPFLNIQKEKLLQYCDENAIPFRRDKSNESNKYARNLIRNELSEQMNQLLPGWQKNVLKLKEFGALNETATNQLLKKIQQGDRISVVELIEMEKSLASSVLKKFVEQQTHKELSSGELESIYQLLSAQTGSVFRIDESTKLVRERDHLTVSGYKEGINVEIKSLDEEFNFEPFRFYKGNKQESEFYLDWDSLKFPLVLRTWESGDRFQPLGMNGSQTVSDHLTNRKVSVTNKEKSLVLVGTDGTIYALFFGGDDDRVGTISELSKATEDTRLYLSVIKKKKL